MASSNCSIKPIQVSSPSFVMTKNLLRLGLHCDWPIGWVRGCSWHTREKIECEPFLFIQWAIHFDRVLPSGESIEWVRFFWNFYIPRPKPPVTKFSREAWWFVESRECGVWVHLDCHVWEDMLSANNLIGRAWIQDREDNREPCIPPFFWNSI